jgi:hypothetical protein
VFLATALLATVVAGCWWRESGLVLTGINESHAAVIVQLSGPRSDARIHPAKTWGTSS